MTTTHVDAIERTVSKTREYLNDLEAELGTEDAAATWRGLRGYLQILRDRLTMDEAAHLAAQLPHLLRGVYYEGFDPGHQPARIRDRDVFLTRLAERAELDDVVQAALLAESATRVLARHIARGELDDVFSQLPKEIRATLEPPVV
jgi:uncharacterized protein (DUF2267 family)